MSHTDSYESVILSHLSHMSHTESYSVPRLVSQVGHPFFGHMSVNQAALLRAEQAMEKV